MVRYKFPPYSAWIAHAKSVAEPKLPLETYVSILEKRFPHIMNAVQAMWGYHELNVYFRKLIVDERGGRQGFPADVWDEISMLVQLHLDIVPEPIIVDPMP
jgi:hypothetical protein